jgi:hypothetical protein
MALATPQVIRHRTAAGPHSLDRMGRSAAGDWPPLYAAAHPQPVAHLIQLTPGLGAVGVEETNEQWRAALTRRRAADMALAAVGEGKGRG